MTLLRLRSRRLVAVATVLVLVAGAGVWWFTSRPASAAVTSQTLTATASTSTVEQAVTTTGTLAPTVNESVSFAASGTVTAVLVAEGDVVTQGQELATIDTLQLEAARTSAAYDLAVARTALEEASDAVTDGDDSDSAAALVTARTSALAVAQSSYDAADAAMADATLTAPVAGLVTSVGVAVGDVVTAGSGASGGGSGASGGQGASSAMTGAGSSTTSSTGAFSIVGTDSWTVSATIGEADVASLSEGDQVEMTADAVSGTVFGIVSEIGRLPSASSTSVTYPVMITVTGDPDGLVDGLSLTTRIIYSRRTDVLTLPTAAVTRAEDGTTTVDVVTQTDDDGAATATETRTVELGETSGSNVEILSGVTEGDVVQYTVAIATQDDSGGQNGQGGQGGDSQLPEGFPDGGQMPDFGGEMPDFSGGMPGGRG
ncbi:MAG: biotin/lipoyl-binding protein [Salana multivorans]|uniref:efflux RND transporter periplasmic adaptor subunit n=1 Tax=Salana multivorans TaxID=120377 RepID=UPI00096564D2|nr:HlyD family efflux transporter periplasmic adaptor subunit [Salana multivorans]MBN8882603.1 biotin/lipoyl-binding protein [Salana multivorans]OJX98357.1 MAG: hypothetical protein BGO96_04020 [Micrococcales bacterium 73-15]